MGWQDWFKLLGPSTMHRLTDVTPVNLEWEMSDGGLAFLMQQEAFRATAYLDSAGIWTIGYGSIRIDGVPVKRGDVITMPAAIRALRQDVKVFTAALRRYIVVPLTQNQIDALVSMMYNIGGMAFSKSTLRKVINAKGPVTEDLFTRWNKVKDPVSGQYVAVNGLTLRRQREYRMYIS